MGREHHKWQIGKLPPLIRPHSLAKHRVLRQYLERYVSVLTRNVRQEQFRLTLVDGFSGGGRYLDSRTKEERPGSPLIMLEAMRDAARQAQQRRSKDFHLDVQYVFVEKEGDALEHLRRVISESEYRSLLDERIRLIHGDFVTHSPEIVTFIKSRGRAGRAIFSLDQFGYSDAPLPTIRDILANLDNAEVILTFATDWLIDYLSANEQTQRIIERVGITLPSKTIETVKQEEDWRRAIQFLLHRQIPERTGAKFYTPFFIRSADSDRAFWLIHLSGHFRARDVMVGLHWQESTSFAHYGRSGLRMLGYDQDRDAAWTDQRMLPGFFFDEAALASSQRELLEQLPETLFNFRDGVVLTDLFSGLANDCPVTLAIMKGVVNDLAKEGLIEIRDESGSKRRRAIQHHSDIIVPSRQKRIYFS